MNWLHVQFDTLYAMPSRNGLNRPSRVRGVGYKMVNMGELFNYDRIADQDMELVPMNDRELQNYALEAGDLLFARQSLVLKGAGKCSIVQSVNGPTTFESHLIRVRLNKNICDPLFYFYYFRSRFSPIRTIVQQCAQAGIKASDLSRIKVAKPPLKIQKRLGEFLSAYDDLIENNRRRVQLLEQAARLLYKEWFVRLRFPGHEHVKFKDGVPEGWDRKKMEDVCDTVGGGTPSTKKSEYWEGGEITWVVPTDVTRNDCLALLDSEKKITEAGLKSSSARIVPPDTILMTSRASVGFFALMDKEACTNQGFINIIPKENWLRMYLLHNLMFRVEEIRSHAGGTTYKEISKGRFRQIPIIVPTKPVMWEFEEFVYQILRQIRILKKQQTKLMAARDILLPRLMNGEIAI